LLQPKHVRKPLVTLGAHVGKNDDSSSSSSSKELASTSAPPLPISLDDLVKICLFCHANVANLDAVDALNHRLECLQIKTPLSCPFCAENFLHPTAWRFSLKAIHLHTCNSSVLALAHWDDFGKLTAALMARGEVAKFLMRTRTGLKQKQRVKRYKARRDLGRSVGLGRYALDFSELRWSHTLEGNKVEVGYVEENSNLWYLDLRDFRRSVYFVLDLDASFDIPDDYKADIQSVTMESLETPPKVFTSQQRPVQTSQAQPEQAVPSALLNKIAEEVRRLLIPAISEMSEEYEDDTEDEVDDDEVDDDEVDDDEVDEDQVDEGEVETDVDLTTSARSEPTSNRDLYNPGYRQEPRQARRQHHQDQQIRQRRYGQGAAREVARTPIRAKTPRPTPRSPKSTKRPRRQDPKNHLFHTQRRNTTHRQDPQDRVLHRHRIQPTLPGHSPTHHQTVPKPALDSPHGRGGKPRNRKREWECCTANNYPKPDERFAAPLSPVLHRP
jgi:hypothetical protein